MEENFPTRSRKRAEKRIRKKKRCQKIKRVFIFSFLAIILLVFGAVKMGLPSKNVPLADEVAGIHVSHEILSEGVLGRPGEKKKIKYIAIHETGNNGRSATAAAHSGYLKKQSAIQKLSWHYTVDDHEIYHHLPDNEVAYHAGDGMVEDGGNKNSIGVELCVNAEGDYEKTLDNGAKLTAYLLKAYHLSISDVKMHYDFSGKNCPEKLIESQRWEEFLTMVQRERAKI